MAMEQKAKVRENRLRRMADRQGLRLTRSRRRDPLALDYGLYWLTDAKTDALASPEAGLDIDGVDRFLTSDRQKPSQQSL